MHGRRCTRSSMTWPGSNTTFADPPAPERRLANVAPASFLLPLLRDKNPMIRFAAVEALRLGDFTFNDAIVDTLLSKIDDRQSYIATAAIKALGRKRITDADEELISCLTMEDSKIAAAALLALAEIGTAPINEYVEDFLDSEDPIRIRAAARVVGRSELTQFAGKLHDLIRQLRDDAEIVPQSSNVNPYLIAVRSLISALDALQYREVIPLLSDLGINHIGLRSLSLRTLDHMGVDIVDMACQAYKHFLPPIFQDCWPTFAMILPATMRRMLKLNQHLNSNRDRLAELGDRFTAGSNTVGKATKIARTYAIIQVDEGMSAYLPAGEYRWSPTNDLRPFGSNYCRTTTTKLSQSTTSGAESSSVDATFDQTHSPHFKPGLRPTNRSRARSTASSTSVCLCGWHLRLSDCCTSHD